MAQGIQTRRGALLMWRLGTLEFGDQSRWARAPESKGMWSFPWPYYDAFFTFHQYKDRLPKRLRVVERSNVPADPSWLVYPDGTSPRSVELDERGWLLDDDISVKPEFWTEQEAWYENVGYRILPLRKFWYDGDVYAHLSKDGVGSSGTFLDGETDWFHMHTSDLARAIIKTRGRQYVERRPTGGLAIGRYAVDHLELFIPAHRGRISSPRDLRA